MPQDWFAANAPKAAPGGDWFAANAPKNPDFRTDNAVDEKGQNVVAGDYSRFGPMQGLLRDQAEGGADASALPMIGGMVGGALGMAGGPITAVGGATAGGGVGEAARLLLEKWRGRPTPDSLGAAAESVGTEAITQGAGQAVGMGVAKGLSRSVPKLREVSERMVRAAVKPTVSALRAVAGSAYTGLDAQAAKMARFIIDNRLTTPEKALKVIKDAEAELRTVITAQDTVTDAPQRALRYLDALERSAAKQALPAEDVAAIRNAAAETLQGPMGKDVITMVSRPHPTLVGANGKPLSVLVPETNRVLRDDVMASEALESARAGSKWGNAKVWGEQKGATVEGGKAVQRAQRDAVKEAIPDAKPILRRQGRAIQAQEVLDRMKLRQGNRDVVSLPGAVVAAGEIAGGGKPILGFATNWLRNNQMKGGIWVDRLSKAVARKDVQGVTAILARLGVDYVAPSKSH